MLGRLAKLVRGVKFQTTFSEVEGGVHIEDISVKSDTGATWTTETLLTQIVPKEHARRLWTEKLAEGYIHMPNLLITDSGE